MSYFITGYNITLFQGDSAAIKINFRNLPSSTTGTIYMQINFPTPVIKQLEITTTEAGFAEAVFYFGVEETKELPTGNYTYGLKFASGLNEDTLLPSLTTSMTFTVKKEIVEGA